MNTRLVESLVQAIRSLSAEERAALEEKLFFEADAPTTGELLTLALSGGSFDFLADEPELYSLEDGEPIVEYKENNLLSCSIVFFGFF